MSMSTEGAIVEEQTSGSAAPSAPGSPKARIKFLCSHGGKILPRPADGHLKYVGGETRVISVPKDISFQEIMKKLTYVIDGEMVLKYQLVPEDIDTLVSVKSDEDLRHMFEEYDRYEKAGAPRLRAFLFPANPVLVDNGSMEPHPLEQRYIDAVNGIVRVPTSAKKHPTINVNMGSYGFNSLSACSSPRSPESCTTDAANHENVHVLSSNLQSGRKGIHKVRSSPSICSLDGQQQGSPRTHQNPHHSFQPYRQPLNHSYQYAKPPIDPHRGGVPERLMSVRSVGRAEGVKYQVDHVPQYYYLPVRHNRGSGGYTRCMQYDDYGAYIDRRLERAGSLPMSLVPLSPRHSNISAKGWDNSIGEDH